MEHSKSEIFFFFLGELGFSKSEIFEFYFRVGASPPSLGSGDSSLRPKQYWKYLGFIFDRSLTFNEHVQRCVAKATSTVKALKMLGNSVCGLSATNKRILYKPSMQLFH
jgi:hypothetical protein